MGNHFLPGNRLQLLNSGAEYFPALLTAIEAAECEIFLESYIFASDAVGETISAALIRAAARGVQVNLTVDGFGARNFPLDFLPRLHEAGIRAMLYRPEISRFHLKRHRLRRLHRKIAVIDARIAFVGGINIVDDHNVPAGLGPRFDYVVRIEGPLLAPIHAAVRRMWEIVSWVNFKRRYRLHPAPPLHYAAVGTQWADFCIRDNIRHRNDILNAYIDAINQAKNEILIANAYFLPGVRFGRALYQAARRGVRITILLQGKTDHPLLRYATQALYAEGLKVGIRIFEYERSFLHAKVAVIDEAWATVGSSNIDPFSLLLAKEANVFVRDPDFAKQLKCSLGEALAQGSVEMHLAALARISWPSRLLRWLSYGLVRLLLGVAGYSQHHWRSDEPGER